MKERIAVIGGGLAGAELVWQLARAEIPVTLYEMKPEKYSPAHCNPDLGELVCSNSFRSADPHTAVGLLKEEMQRAGSLFMQTALETRVPAGRALAVDRERFARLITRTLEETPGVEVIRREVSGLDDPRLTGCSRVVLAAGPLASQPLTRSLLDRIGGGELYFYDAIAPIVAADSIDWDKVFWGSRYEPESTDYLNCPLDEDQYNRLREELLRGRRVLGRPFEDQTHFEACLPIETLAERGEMTMAFGPLKPVGLTDPRTGRRPFAVVQLRPENREKTMFNMVGFQTKLTHGEQKRIFRLIPGLESARFERLGSIHRNTYVRAPEVLTPDLELRSASDVFLAGQITGVEGYVESAACGLWLGMHLAGTVRGRSPGVPPPETAVGGLLRHLQSDSADFQPMNVNFGLLPPLREKVKKQQRKERYMQRARRAWSEWASTS